MSVASVLIAILCAVSTALPEPRDGSEVPAWTALPDFEGPPADVGDWRPDEHRPTLLVFSASYCGPCIASAYEDRVLAREFGQRFQIGVALVESTDDFRASRLARVVSGMEVWSKSSVAEQTERCGVETIPAICLVDHGRVVHAGHPWGVRRILAGYGSVPNRLLLRDDQSRRDRAEELLERHMRSASDARYILEVTNGYAARQGAMAEELLVREGLSDADLELALGLARSAVVADGGTTPSSLNAYATALSRLGRRADAARVGARVIAVCDVWGMACSDERARARALIAAAER